MYLKIGTKRYPCSRRVVTREAVKYLSVRPDPGKVSGTLRLYRDDGFLLSTDRAGDYGAQTYRGTVLTLRRKEET